MSDQKLLTICLPTYNRAKYLKMQLERFSSIPSYMWNDVRIFISDNCSTDETESIGKAYASKSDFDIVYSKNEENLGMDGNFVTCFKSAKTKYVWLLGDDDIIIINELILIIETLHAKEVGVMHLGIGRKEKDSITIYNNSEDFLKEIGIWISFISSNIVNTKFVKQINFEKYYGSYFTLIPLYLTAMIRVGFNIMVNEMVFEAGKDYGRNGGYNLAQVFVVNYLKIFDEYKVNGLISERLYQYERKVAFDFVMPMVYKYVFRNNPSNYEIEGTWMLLFKEYGYSPVLYKIVKIVFFNLRSKILR